MTRIRCQAISLGLVIFLLSACASLISPVRWSEEAQPVDTAVPTEMIQSGLSFPLTPIPTPMYERCWSTPFPNGLVREIAYLSNRTGLAEIWLLDLVTGLERQLTETDCNYGYYTGGYAPGWYVPGVQGFTWAPDGQRIAYLTTCTSAGQLARLNVYDLEAGVIITVTDRVDINSYPSWGPSSDRLIFSSLAWGGVYIAEIGRENISHVKMVTNTFCAFPTWSPDGRYIAYRGPEVGLPGTGSRTYLSIVDSEWNHLTYDPPPWPTAPGFLDSRAEWIAAFSHNGLAWSHNSRYLAIANVREYVPGGLGLVEVTDQVAHKRSGVSQHSFNSFGPDFYNPIFSPADETLYFVSVRPDAEYGWPFGLIYSVSVRGLLDNLSPYIQVVSPEDHLAGFPSLSPDGNWLVYAVKLGEAIEIWLQAVDGISRQRLVGDGFINTQPVWRPVTRSGN